MTWLLILIGGAVASLLLVPLVGAREPWDLDETPDRLRHLKRARDRVMRTLKDLENDLREGSLAPEDHAELRAAYKDQAVGLTRELNRVRETVVRQIREGPEARPLSKREREVLEKTIARRVKKHV